MNNKELWYIKRRPTVDIQRMNSPLNVSQELWVKLRTGPGYTFISRDPKRVFYFLLYSPIFAFIPPSLASLSATLSQNRSGLLGEQKAEAFLHRHPVSGELVVWGEAGRVGRAGGLPIRTNLLWWQRWKEKATRLSWLMGNIYMIKGIFR